MSSIDFAGLDLAQLNANVMGSESTTEKPDSIRQIIRRGLLARKSTNEIAAEVKALHPTSMAAAKSVKHIAYYRCLMRKAGELK